MTALGYLQRPVLAWREITAADIAAVHALHLAATEVVGRPDLIRPESRSFFEKIVAAAGKIIGVFDETGLRAYGVLQWDLSFEEDPYGPLGLGPGDGLAKLAGTAVRPSAWGQGLHRQLIAWRIIEARRLGFRHLYATSAPGNARSWTNLMDEGFRVRAVKEQYGGHLRYLLARPVDKQADADTNGDWCEVADIGRQRDLIASGREGAAWRAGKDGHAILYVPRP
ncbi:GNAT family N-acetyltransferase [Rhodoligotrophos defluvii]|uniref:GNAT family N-acetyltransferase n=1 Tax=Rhodoligotrophos defluvii TaxID=2561934 RepID=UPI0010C95FAA|nr:GNAT family N-acetyltransferase [Rhodoligotrophos defluvii]